MGSVFMQDSLQTLTENVNSLHNVNTTYLFFEFTINQSAFKISKTWGCRFGVAATHESP